MKLIDALKNVKPDRSVQVHVDIESFASSLGIDIGYIDNVHDRLVGYYLTRWLCTDSWVGVKAVFLDDELIGYSVQEARKSEEDFFFTDVITREKAKNFVTSLILREDQPSNLMLPDAEIEETYKIEFAEQILEESAIYEGEKVQIIRPTFSVFKRGWYYTKGGDVITKQCESLGLEVRQFAQERCPIYGDDNILKVVKCADLDFPLHVN